MYTKKENRTPTALQYLQDLYLRDPSDTLQQYYSKLKNPKPQTRDVFIVGLQEFMRIANLTSEARNIFFGNQFNGLHYNNDLAALLNQSFQQEINSYQLTTICPPLWDSFINEDWRALVYRGDKPSMALDKLIKGPTVIDCGMFCQLSIWFGIRYLLGDEIFDQLFGNAPFYLTQLVFTEIENPTKAYLGNPIYPFLTLEQGNSKSEIALEYIPNQVLYPLKHLAGNHAGENCIVINGEYTIFEPKLIQNRLNRKDIEKFLQDSFNAPPDIHDRIKLAYYQAQDPDAITPGSTKSYSFWINASNNLAKLQIDENEKAQKPSQKVIKLAFNFEKFCRWVFEMVNKISQKVDYFPLSNVQLEVNQDFLKKIPIENRDVMSFQNFRVDTPLQEELYSISMKFCKEVMAGQSCNVILTGKPGIGKTALAISCAKELISRGKKVIWITEVMMRGWTNKAVNFEELEACRDKITPLLEEDPDVVILDDDNLVGYSGQILFEEINAWYVNNPSKGLFITSNEKISYQKLSGLKKGKYYLCPIFPGYTSQSYQNTIVRSDLEGQSLRPTLELSLSQRPDDQKISALKSSNSLQSIGIIITPKSYEELVHDFGELEFIPSFKSESLGAISSSLKLTGELGSIYETLTTHQKNWTRRFPVNQITIDEEGFCMLTDTFDFMGIGIRPFSKTKYNVIAIELISEKTCQGKEEIERECLMQLLSVINYAHDKGRKKIIIINKTLLSHDIFLEKIKEGISSREKERSIARLDNLLFSSALTCPEQTTPKKVTRRNHDLSKLLMKSTSLFTPVEKSYIIDQRHTHPSLQNFPKNP